MSSFHMTSTRTILRSGDVSPGEPIRSEKTRALAAGTDKIATQNAKPTKPDCRITSAEADLRKA
jgi:hypothetical protein